MADWQNSLRDYFSGLLSFLFPAYFLKDPCRIALERGDALNQNLKTVGIGKLDNRASIKKLFGIPLKLDVQIICTHVLTEDKLSGNSQQDTNMIYPATLLWNTFLRLQIVPGFGSRCVLVKVNLLVFKAKPETLNENIVKGPPAALHADSYVLVFQYTDEHRAEKLNPLIGIHDVRLR